MEVNDFYSSEVVYENGKFRVEVAPSYKRENFVRVRPKRMSSDGIFDLMSRGGSFVEWFTTIEPTPGKWWNPFDHGYSGLRRALCEACEFVDRQARIVRASIKKAEREAETAANTIDHCTDAVRYLGALRDVGSIDGTEITLEAGD